MRTSAPAGDDAPSARAKKHRALPARPDATSDPDTAIVIHDDDAADDDDGGVDASDVAVRIRDGGAAAAGAIASGAIATAHGAQRAGKAAKKAAITAEAGRAAAAGAIVSTAKNTKKAADTVAKTTVKTYKTGKKVTLTTIDWVVFLIKLPFFLVAFTISIPLQIIGWVMTLVTWPFQCCCKTCDIYYHKGYDLVYLPMSIVQFFGFRKYELCECCPDPKIRVRKMQKKYLFGGKK